MRHLKFFRERNTTNHVIFVCATLFFDKSILFDDTMFIVGLGSLGILFYTLLTGSTPFVHDKNDSHDVILARTNVKLHLNGPTWNRVTDDAKVSQRLSD
jgi:serine/threonine protein kinase